MEDKQNLYFHFALSNHKNRKSSHYKGEPRRATVFELYTTLNYLSDAKGQTDSWP